MLVYSDPAQTENKVQVMQFEKKEDKKSLPIKLQILSVAKDYAEFFAKPDPAIFIDEAIFLLHYDSTTIVSFKREAETDVVRQIADQNGVKHNWTCVTTQFDKFGDYCRLMEQSLFYRTRPFEAYPKNRKIKLSFPPKL